MNNSRPFTLAVLEDRLRIEGGLDFACAAGMTPRLRQCIAELPTSFTIDLSGLTAFNSAVLVFMLDCVRMASAVNKHCHFSGATPELFNLLQMAALGDLVDTGGSSPPLAPTTGN